MDLYVERQCIEQMKVGNLRQFILLFDEYFGEVYKYIARRIGEGEQAEYIARLTFLDALGQVQNTPTDVSYLVWLYSLAKPRVWEHIDSVGFQEAEETGSEVAAQVNKMFSKLSLEEREIMRLKFFEQVTDGDVMVILGSEESTVGPTIYRVLKRAHFLLFGETAENQQVYFGQLSGLLEEVRNMEQIKIPEVFKLTLKAEFTNRIDRQDFAIDGEEIVQPKKRVMDTEAKGSDDPAKIFVNAVKEMREEEAWKKIKEQRKIERREKLTEIFDMWKKAIFGVVVAVFILALAIVGLTKVDWQALFDKVKPDGGEQIAACDIEVVYDGDFTDEEKADIDKGISERICGHFDDVSRLEIYRTEDKKVFVSVDINDWMLEYDFVNKTNKVKNTDEWRIKKYARTSSSNG